MPTHELIFLTPEPRQCQLLWGTLSLGRPSQMTKGTMVTSLITQLQNGTLSRLLLGVLDATVTWG